MRIFLLEYITAGGLSGMPLPASLLREGTLMRDALLSDFGAIDDIEIVTTYDARLGFPEVRALKIRAPEASAPKHVKQAISIDSTANAKTIWQEILQSCDAALVVAPETNGVLSSLTQMVEASNVRNLGCTQVAVDIASNKYDTYHKLNNANILTIPTYTVREFLSIELAGNKSFNRGCVTKPIDGAGCEDTLYFKDAVALQTRLDLDAGFALGRQHTHIVQPYQTGTPASISMLCTHGKAWVLSCNQQAIEIKPGEIKPSDIHKTTDNAAAIQYKGCHVNGLSLHRDAFTKLADSIAAAMPSLHGYIGVDVIINNEDIYVVEINPRITTSYIGLRESLNCNPAKLILDLACSESSSSTFKLPENMTTNTVEISVNE